jgi:hypothetical protein
MFISKAKSHGLITLLSCWPTVFANPFNIGVCS